MNGSCFPLHHCAACRMLRCLLRSLASVAPSQAYRQQRGQGSPVWLFVCGGQEVYGSLHALGSEVLFVGCMCRCKGAMTHTLSWVPRQQCLVACGRWSSNAGVVVVVEVH